MLDIIVPVYNEKDNIRRTIEAIENKVKTSHNILVIYDFEEDNTLPVVKDLLAKQANLMLLKNMFGRGVLNAIKAGFAAAKNEAVLVTMADLSDDLGDVDKMYKKIEIEGDDIVCGSRYMKGGEQIGGPPLKSFLSRMAGLSLYYLFGFPIHDVSNSFKMYRKAVLDKIKIESTGGFELGMEIVVKAYKNGYKIAELPTRWTDRTAGQSRFMFWRWLPKYLRWYFYAVRGKTSVPAT